MKRHFIFLAFVAIMLQSCYLFKVPENIAPLTSRFKGTPQYKHLDDKDAPISIELHADIDPVNPDQEKTIFDFKGEAQQALVDYYGKKVKDPADLPGKLNFKIRDDDEMRLVTAYTTKDLILTISVKPHDFFASVSTQAPTFGDRLEKVNLKLTLDAANKSLQFKSWNKINTQFGRYYVGSASYTGSQELNINPSVPIGAANLSLGSYDLKNQYQETDTIAPQFVQSNGILHAYDFAIEQNGTAKTSVMGNTIVQLKIISDQNHITYVFKADNILDDNGNYNSAEKVGLTKQAILFPAMPPGQTQLKGTLSCEYIYRHIDKGLSTYSESDDEVTYMYGTVNTDATILIKDDQLKPAQYFIKYDGQNLVFNDTRLPDHTKSFSNMVFKSFAEAKDFMNWLITMAQKSGTAISVSKKRFEVKVLKEGTPNQLIPLDKDFDVAKFNIMKTP